MIDKFWQQALKYLSAQSICSSVMSYIPVTHRNSALEGTTWSPVTRTFFCKCQQLANTKGFAEHLLSIIHTTPLPACVIWKPSQFLAIFYAVVRKDVILYNNVGIIKSTGVGAVWVQKKETSNFEEMMSCFSHFRKSISNGKKAFRNEN